jgi:hypothetical protein
MQMLSSSTQPSSSSSSSPSPSPFSSDSTVWMANGTYLSTGVFHERKKSIGFCVPSHSAQGLTAERILVHADIGVHPELLNSRFAYVSLSRGSHEATLFTDDMKKLAHQLSSDVSKTSALEIAPTSLPGRGLEIAL